jgi:hypothetical protein
LPDVDNVHTADRVTHCDGTSWTMTLPQGHTITGSGGTWPVPANDDALPYNLRAVQLSAKGDGEVVIDNYAKVSQALVDLGVSPKPKEASGFCAFTELPHRQRRYSFGAAGLLFGVLLLRRRRQR